MHLHNFKRVLLKRFLGELVYRLGNDSCNDFDLSEYIPDNQARYYFLIGIEPDYCDPFDANKDYKICSNISLVNWLIKSLNL